MKKYLGFIVVFIAWEILSFISKDPALPSLISIVNALYDLIVDKEFYIHIYSSIEVIVLGISVALIGGFLGGVFIFYNKTLKEMFLPVVEAVRGVPGLTLFPLLISTMGIGLESRIFIICWTAWPPILIQTIHALDIDTGIVNAAMDCGANEWQVLWKIRIGASKKQLLTGVKIAISGGWIGLVAAEMLGATKGLGYLLTWSSQSFQYSRVYAIILIIALLGFIMNYFVNLIQKKLK